MIKSKSSRCLHTLQHAMLTLVALAVVCSAAVTIKLGDNQPLPSFEKNSVTYISLTKFCDAAGWAWSWDIVAQKLTCSWQKHKLIFSQDIQFYTIDDSIMQLPVAPMRHYESLYLSAKLIPPIFNDFLKDPIEWLQNEKQFISSNMSAAIPKSVSMEAVDATPIQKNKPATPDTTITSPVTKAASAAPVVPASVVKSTPAATAPVAPVSKPVSAAPVVPASVAESTPAATAPVAPVLKPVSAAPIVPASVAESTPAATAPVVPAPASHPSSGKALAAKSAPADTPHITASKPYSPPPAPAVTPDPVPAVTPDPVPAVKPARAMPSVNTPSEEKTDTIRSTYKKSEWEDLSVQQHNSNVPELGTIVIDPGHGGKDPGAIGPNGVKEKDIVLSIGLKLAEQLKQYKGLTVYMTRSDDTFIPLVGRTRFANDKKADVFVSIHANSIRGTPKKKEDVKGYKIYFLSQAKNEEDKVAAMQENEVIRLEDHSSHNYDNLENILIDMAGNEYLRESQDLSIMVDQVFSQSLSTISKLHRGIGQANFWVLNGAYMPSILVETGFISNPDEELLLQSESFQDSMAATLCQAIVQFKQKIEAGH